MSSRTTSLPENLREGDLVGVPETFWYRVIDAPTIEDGIVSVKVQHPDGGLGVRVWNRSEQSELPLIESVVQEG